MKKIVTVFVFAALGSVVIAAMHKVRSTPKQIPEPNELIELDPHEELAFHK